MDRFGVREWIIRRIGPSDGRYTLATLTGKGRQKLVDSVRGHVAQVRRLVSDPLTAVQRRHLVALTVCERPSGKRAARRRTAEAYGHAAAAAEGSGAASDGPFG